uniref:RNA-directed DNA polymerase n=1 Tax=Tanacetum cinerariifolium TaxID=118510 RepID=A0A699HIN4_TANCI|nr:reverse transcriptase domain-containing protein [Tanacetum cinerariifolium]
MSTRSSARNLFPPLDNLELTIQRRSRADATLLNEFEMAAEENGDLPVPDLRTMEELCQPSLNGRGGPITLISIQATNFGLKNDMIQQVQNSCQFYGFSGDDANKHLDKFLHVTQSIKVNRVPFISTVSQTQNVYATGAYQGGNSYQPQGASHGQNLHPAYQASGFQAPVHKPSIPQPQVVTPNEFTNFMKANDAILKNMQTNMTSLTKSNLELKNMFGQFMKMNTASSSGLGTLPSNTVTNSKEKLKVERKTEVTKDMVPPTNNGSTKDVQPLVVQTETPISNSEPVVALVSAPKLTKNLQYYALILMPKFGPTIKTFLTNKDKLYELARTPLNEHCSAVLLKKLPEKLRDPGNINLMPFSMWNKLSLHEFSPTCMTLELTDRSISHPFGVAEDVFVKVGTFHFPADFVVVDFDAYPRVPLILRRSSLKTGRALIDVFKGELTLRVGREAITFNLDQTSRYSSNYNDMTVNRIDIIDMAYEEYSDFLLEEVDAFLTLEDDPTSPEVDHSYFDPEGDILLLKAFLNDDTLLPRPTQGNYLPQVRKELKIYEAKTDKSSIDEPPEVKLKYLPPHLEYAFLEGDDKLPVIIAKYLSDEEKTALITVLKLHNPWVSLIHCVPKKGGFTVVKNEENELILTHLVTGWRVCIDYCKLNEATRKDHFPLPFMDQMLERLAGNEYYCFLDGLLGYFPIFIDLKDQEKTTFTCPYGKFAYCRMPFGLCNASGTFQRCMMAIFHDMIKKMMEVFMDDFSEKSHFTVKEGIVPSHKISKNGIEIARPMTRLLEKDTIFFFSKDCVEASQTLKTKLNEAPILIAPDWDFLFELMCDASDFAIGAVLRQRQEKHFSPIHNASKTMTEAKSNYTTMEKEMLAVVYAFEKFWSYLIMNKSIVYTDHSVLKYLFAKKDSKATLLRWVLLLQEFIFKVLDPKGAENLAANHLS